MTTTPARPAKPRPLDTASLKGKRRLAREMAVQMLYQHDLAGSTAAQIVKHFDVRDFALEALGPEVDLSVERERLDSAFEYAAALAEGAINERDAIDDLIRSQAEHWRLERMSGVDRNVLRVAIYEMLYRPEVPKLVVLDEAIEIAKRFGTEQSGRFVNGLLDGLLKAHEFPGRRT